MMLNETDTQMTAFVGASVAYAVAGGEVSTAPTARLGEKRLLMRADGLRKSFGGQVVLDGVDFELHEGQVVLLRGANGSGKTTLLNMLTGHIEPDAGTIELRTNGAVEHFRFPRKWWQELNPWDQFLPERVAREGVGRSWQDTRLFSTLTLRDNIVVAGREDRHEHNPARILFSPRRSRRVDLHSEGRASSLLTDLGLGDRSQSSADKVSLGQTKRVAIARAVHAGAKILFLDEPLSGLDAPGVKSVLDLLKSLVDSHRLTLVIVEHVWSARHIIPLADTLWTLDQGKLKQESNGSPTQSEADCSDDKGAADIASLFPEYSQTKCLDLPNGAVLELYRKPDEDAGESLLEVQDLVVFRGKRLVIGTTKYGTTDAQGLGFNLKAGDLAVLRAPNGWGKTTLLDAISGILPCQCGRITLNGIDISQMRIHQRIAAGMDYLRSDSTAFPSLTSGHVADFRSSGRTLRTSGELDHRKYGDLSGGERQRVRFDSIPRYLKGVYMMDEPFSALDHDVLDLTANFIKESVCSAFAAVLVAVPLSKEGDPA